MRTHRCRTKSTASALTLHALEPRTLLSTTASLAQLIHLNTPHHSNSNAGATPLLIIPAGTLIPVDVAPLYGNLNAPFFPLPNETGSMDTTLSELPWTPSNCYTVTTGAATYTFPSGPVNVGTSITGVSGTYQLYTTDQGFTSFDPISNPTGVTVKYTYFGDVNLDGTVDANDYPILNQGSESTTLAGAITSGDYSLLNQNFLNGSTSGSTTTDSGVLTINSGNSTYLSNTSAAGTLNLNAGGAILTNGTNTPTAPLSLYAKGTLTLNGANTFSPIASSGTFILANLNGGSSPTENSGTGTVNDGFIIGCTSQTLNVVDSIPNTIYSFRIVNGRLVVIIPPNPAPSDPTTIPPSISDDPGPTTQIAIPTTL